MTRHPIRWLGGCLKNSRKVGVAIRTVAYGLVQRTNFGLRLNNLDQCPAFNFFGLRRLVNGGLLGSFATFTII